MQAHLHDVSYWYGNLQGFQFTSIKSEVGEYAKIITHTKMNEEKITMQVSLFVK